MFISSENEQQEWYHSNVAVFETSLDCDIGMTDALW